MDKQEVIDSLQEIIDCLRKDVEEIFVCLPKAKKPKPRYEMRYWNDNGSEYYNERTNEPDEVFDYLDTVKTIVMEYILIWSNVEIYDSTLDKVIISYTESKD